MIFIITFLFIISSCSSFSIYDDFDLDYNSKQIFFLSNDTNNRFEAPYYDAIVELRRDYPDAFNNMQVLVGEKASKYSKLFEIDQQPAIVVYYQDHILVKISGNATKHEIIKPIEAVFSDESPLSVKNQ